MKTAWLLLCVLVYADLGSGNAAAQAIPRKDVRRTDAQIGEIAAMSLKLSGPSEQRAALDLLKAYRFKSVKAPEREKALYAQGILEERLGRSKDAAQTFHKLERTWPSFTDVDGVRRREFTALIPGPEEKYAGEGCARCEVVGCDRYGFVLLCAPILRLCRAICWPFGGDCGPAHPRNA